MKIAFSTIDSGQYAGDTLIKNDKTGKIYLQNQIFDVSRKTVLYMEKLEDVKAEASDVVTGAIFGGIIGAMIMSGQHAYYVAITWKNEQKSYLYLLPEYYRELISILPSKEDYLNEKRESAVSALKQEVLASTAQAASQQAQPTQQMASIVVNQENIESILNRIDFFLEDGEWDKADHYCEQVLNYDSTNARAYLGKLMAELHVRKRDELGKCENPFADSSNYQKAVRFGSKELASELTGYLAQISKRNNIARSEEAYNTAKKMMNNASTSKECYDAAMEFHKIFDYKDSAELEEKCRDRAKELQSDVQRKKDATRSAFEAIKSYSDPDRASHEEKLTCLKQRLLSLKAARDNFDSVQKEIVDADSSISDLKQQLSELESRKASLGLFDRKEKKQIEEKVEQLNGELKSKEADRATKVEKLCGCSSLEQIERAISDCRDEIYTAESAMPQGQTFTYQQAVSYFNSNRSGNPKMEILGAICGAFDSCKIGKYRQTSLVSSPVEWIVLESDDKTALLLSKYALNYVYGCKIFDETNNAQRANYNSWQESTIRAWLNCYFYDSVFKDEEKRFITSNLSMDHEGNKIYDKVFLLSEEEVERLLPWKEYRVCVSTEYAAEREGRAFMRKPSVDRVKWLLRTSLPNIKYDDVDKEGSIGHKRINGFLRPAIRINYSLLMNL